MGRVMADLRKIKIEGKWDVGYALDLHVKSSDFLGYDELGHPQYDTTRTDLGELVYKFKYGNDKTVLDDIIRIICNSFTFKSIDVIIPVPPSKSRVFQPVVEIAKRLGKVLGIQVLENAILKIKNTPELKNVSTFEEKYSILKNAFKIADVSLIRNKTILLLDDLYQSGATLTAITELLKKGGVSKVKVLTLTKTRRG
jgi:predicted amidophosphoribosyltransferase